MNFCVAKAARLTGQMLERLVREALVEKGIAEPDAVICYGAGYSGPKKALNATCSRLNKMQQGQELEIKLPGEALPIIDPNDPGPNAVVFAALANPEPLWIARRIRHTKGKDIRTCRTYKGVQAALANHDFFTPLVDSDTEYRAWVYRKRVLAVYEKRLTEPEKNVKFGRNRANGWTFHLLASEEIPENVRRVAVAAVKALSLDFGAVDILGKRDAERGEMRATVLEVNSAPGVSDEHRSAIVKLVNRIVKWIEHDCPGRTD